jgi:hypothetical protein
MRPRFLIEIIEYAIATAINRGHDKVLEEDCLDAGATRSSKSERATRAALDTCLSAQKRYETSPCRSHGAHLVQPPGFGELA